MDALRFSALSSLVCCDVMEHPRTTSSSSSSSSLAATKKQTFREINFVSEKVKKSLAEMVNADKKKLELLTAMMKQQNKEN